MTRAALLAVLGALLLAPASAHASFPARNGGLAITLEGCQDNRFIRLLTAAGRTVRDLTPRCAPAPEKYFFRDTFAADWSPGGSRLAYVDASRDGTPPTFRSVSAAGTDEREVPVPSWEEGPYGGEQAPSFSPDGKRIAYELDAKIHTAAIDGSDVRVLPTPDAIFTRPRWSPDGATLAVQRLGGSEEGIWLISATTGRVLRQLSEGGLGHDWSPDGRRIVFHSRFQQDEVKGGAAGGNLFVVRADGRGGPRRIVHRKRVAETSPVWSPDGRWIAWVSLRFTAGDVGFRIYPSLWRVRARGGRPRRLRLLPRVTAVEGEYHRPKIAWQPRP